MRTQQPSRNILETLLEFCSRLTYLERKSLVTLARAQHFPSPDVSPILFSKVVAILDQLVCDPPYRHGDATQLLTTEGKHILHLISSPLLSGLVLVLALGGDISDSEATRCKEISFNKEFMATQTIRAPSSWNWEAILDPDAHPGEVIHPMYPHLSSLQAMFSKNLPSLKRKYQDRILFPHYTGRGISTETKRLLERRVFSGRIRKVAGNRRSFHGATKWDNVSSRDIVHHYIRTGYWVPGKTEMKQRWYPSGLLPRTYFSWGGCDIAVSTYLRNFFNDLADKFPPTEKHQRVRPNWLRRYESDQGGFLFYDLTSFTSWFHEHVPFLRALGDRFMDVSSFLLGSDLSLSYHSIGSLIHSYTDYCNDFPSYVIHDNLLDGLYRNREFNHWCAGFLGIPGNLITCTIPHGLAVAASLDDEFELQVPGDDVGSAFYTDQHRMDIMKSAQTLGVLQFDKVFYTPQECLYLKRRVLVGKNSVNLAEMLIFPLLPYLYNPREYNTSSNRFQLPDRDQVFKRTSSVLVSFTRDLWNISKGVLDPDVASTIQLFLEFVHDRVRLPYGAIFQGALYGDDPFEHSEYSGIKMKFSIEDISNLYTNPDRLFAGKYIYRMTIRDISGIQLTENFDTLKEGETIIVRRSKGWKFLEDMGYVSISGIPGEKVDLFGADARDAYLSATEPPYREVEVLSDLDTCQLRAVDLIPDVGVESYEGSGTKDVDRVWRSAHYGPYLDLDAPRYKRTYDDFLSDDEASEDEDLCVDRGRVDFSLEPDLSLLY